MDENARTYLDWAATTLLCPEAVEAMEPYMRAGLANVPFGANPNSLHSEGRAVFAALEQAREDIARVAGARPDEIVFTGGATESDYMALLGLVRAARDAKRKSGSPDTAHVIVSAIEHSAVLQAAVVLAREGVDIDYVAVDAQGRVNPQQVQDLMRPNTLLVSVMAANNEVGSVQSLAEIAAIAHAGGALMHTDAAQAFCKIPFDCHGLGIDAASFSAHKVCGPKGAGALFIKAGSAFHAPVTGGGQESGRRGGTQNVGALVGFAAAAKALAGDTVRFEEERCRMKRMRDRLYEGLCAHPAVHPSVNCLANTDDYLPNIANVCVEGFESETLILRLDKVGFAVAGGSACSSHSLEPSKVLLALGINRDLALGSMRVSIGRDTTNDDIERFLEAFASIVELDG